MKKELDDLLCKKYPKIFRDRYGDMKITCMVWGFECGDGWFNIIDTMCGIIQRHIDFSKRNNIQTRWENYQLKKAIYKNKVEEYANKKYKLFLNGYRQKYVDKMLENLESFILPVPDRCQQLVAIQVKEKFGTLRFYTSGGDSFTDGVKELAETMSAVTCEHCGYPGKIISDTGWYKCRCNTCT